MLNVMSDEAALPRTKTELLEAVRRERAALEGLVAPLSDAVLTGPRDAAGWSVADHLAHIAVWEDALVAILHGESPAAAFGLTEAEYEDAPDADAINRIVHERDGGRTAAEVRERFRRSYARVYATLEAAPESAFGPVRGDGPSMPKIVGDTSGHYAEHRPWIAALIG
jgi:uncharacterized protein (TIGR03083 family)